MQEEANFATFLKASGEPKELSQPFLGHYFLNKLHLSPYEFCFKGYIRKHEKIFAREIGFMKILMREFKGVFDTARYNLKKLVAAMPVKMASSARLHFFHRYCCEIKFGLIRNRNYCEPFPRVSR